MKKILLVSALVMLTQQAFSAKIGAVPGSKSKLLERDFNEYEFSSEEQLKNNGVRGYVQFGLDTVTFENKLKDRNQLYPYAKVEVFPFANSNFYIDAKTAYRFDYNKPSSKSYVKEGNSMKPVYGESEAVYTELNLGSMYRNGKFFINYKAGFSNYNFSNVKLENRTEIRFIPRASYTFNEKFSWYLKGYLGYVEAEEFREKSGKVDAYTKNHYDYIHKLESGFTYLPTEDLAFSLGALHRTKEEYAGEFVEWMYISKLEYNAYSSNNLEVIPYFWYLHTPNGQSGLSKTTPDEFKDESGTKLGVKVSYEISEKWNLEGDIFWNRLKKNVQGTKGSVLRAHENATIVKLAVKRYF